MCCPQNCLRTLAIALSLIQYSHSAFLRCYKGSLDNYVITPLEKPLQLSNSTCIDPSLPTVLYTFGYRGRVAGPATTAIMTAYLAKKKRNLVLLDWEEEAKSGRLGIPLGYMLSAFPSSRKIGDNLGEALVTLAKNGLNMTQVHLIGHSLGAHIMAFAGRWAREKGHVVSRITGLDPARAMFEGSFALPIGLDRTCAKFVDIVHSDPGGYGTSKPTGTVDIWPNYAGKGGSQPGCPNGDFDMFSSEAYSYDPDITGNAQNMTKLQKMIERMKPNLCNHDRSWQYFVEAIAHPTAFPAGSAANYEAWVNSAGNATKTIYMGDLSNPRARGNFFLTTNSKSPYSKGQEGLKPDDNQARRRRSSTLTRLLKYLR